MLGMFEPPEAPCEMSKCSWHPPTQPRSRFSAMQCFAGREYQRGDDVLLLAANVMLCSDCESPSISSAMSP